jgi:hypothetical protein
VSREIAVRFGEIEEELCVCSGLFLSLAWPMRGRVAYVQVTYAFSGSPLGAVYSSQRPNEFVIGRLGDRSARRRFDCPQSPKTSQ